MKKAVLSISLALVMVFAIFGLAACGEKEYNVNWTAPTVGVTSFSVKNGEVNVEPNTKIKEGTELTVSWVAAANYTVTVKVGTTNVTSGGKYTVNADTIFTITATENQIPFTGIIVTTRAELLEAVLVEDADIRLGANIEETDDLVISATQNLSFKLDLYGYSIASEIDFRNDLNSGANLGNSLVAEIIDSVGTGVIGTKDDQAVWYGFLISGNNKVDITLTGIKAVGFEGGIYTRSAANGVKVTAVDCIFEGNEEQTDAAMSTIGRTVSAILIKHTGAGAYIAGYGTYSFENCSFRGNTGFITKNGEIELINCTIVAVGEYVSPAAWSQGTLHTGNGIFMNLSDGAKILNIVITGGSITANGYAIEEAVTQGSGHVVSIDVDGTSLNGVEGATQSSKGLFD